MYSLNARGFTVLLGLRGASLGSGLRQSYLIFQSTPGSRRASLGSRAFKGVLSAPDHTGTPVNKRAMVAPKYSMHFLGHQGLRELLKFSRFGEAFREA
jgi:hypothetical protein